MTATNWRAVLLLWAAGLGSAAQFAKISITYPELQAHYAGSGTAIGFAVSLVGFVGLCLGVVAGVLAARLGYRRVLIAALALGALASGFQALLPPLPLLLASRLVEGASHLAIVVAAPTLMALLSSDQQRGLTLSLWSTFFGVAFAVLAFAGLPLVQRHGPDSLYAAHGVYMAMMAGLLMFAVPKDDAPPAGAAPFGRLLRDHLRIYRSPSLSAPALGWVCYTATFPAILTIMPAQLPITARASLVAFMPIAGILVAMSVGVLLLRIVPAVRLVQAGFALCLLSAWLIWMTPGQLWTYLALAAAMGLVQGPSFAAVAQLNADPGAQAEAHGAMSQMGNLGTTLGTPALAVLVAGWGVTGFLIFAVICFGSGFGVHHWAAIRRKAAAV